jgi:hypothetical protein
VPPMQVPPSCSLDEAGAREQRARYARLAGAVRRLVRETDSVEIEFGQDLDPELLEEALAVERECCPFFQFSFDRSEGRLLVTVADESMLPALDAIAYGFGAERDVR